MQSFQIHIWDEVIQWPTDSFLGKVEPLVGGGTDVWEVASVEITDLNLHQIPSEWQDGSPCYFEGVIALPDHLVFQTREFNSKSDLWDACGQLRSNLMVSSAYLYGPNQICIGNNTSPLYYSVATPGFAGDPAPVSSFTLYVFARFVD